MNLLRRFSWAGVQQPIHLERNLAAKHARVLLFTGMCVAWVGCGQPPAPSPLDSSLLTVVPGVGISNVVALGMTVAEVKASAGKVLVKKSGGRDGAGLDIWDIAVPALGAYLAVPTKDGPDGPVVGITFWTDQIMLREIGEINDWHSMRRFRGSLSCGLSFLKEKTVHLEDVLRVMGQPDHIVVEPDGSQILEVHSLMRNGQSAWLKARGDDYLNYPATGIAFVLVGGAVNRFSIFDPTEFRNYVVKPLTVNKEIEEKSSDQR